jgi:hypothetical protein
MSISKEHVTQPKGQASPQGTGALKPQGEPKVLALMPVHTAQADQSQAPPALSGSTSQTGADTEPVVSAPVKPTPSAAGVPLTPHPWPSRREHRWLAVALALVIVLLLIGGVGVLFASLQAEEQAPASPSVVSSEFPLGSHRQIEVSNDIGTIHVSRGEAGKNVSMQETIWNQKQTAPDAIQVDYSSDINIIHIEVKPNNWIDLDITLPADVGLTLSTKTGDIAVTNLNGQMHLTSETGSITVKRSRLNGTSLLMTNGGSISFRGTIDAHSTASFLTGSGSIVVTLPSEAAFHVDAIDDLGTITVDFPGVTATRLSATHSEAYGDVGNPPRARVILVSRSGLITLLAG